MYGEVLNSMSSIEIEDWKNFLRLGMKESLRIWQERDEFSDQVALRLITTPA